jgi:hypothetical protein
VAAGRLHGFPFHLKRGRGLSGDKPDGLPFCASTLENELFHLVARRYSIVQASFSSLTGPLDGTKNKQTNKQTTKNKTNKQTSTHTNIEHEQVFLRTYERVK